MKWTFLHYFLFFFIFSCQNMKNDGLDIQGHRGCRGLMPENTLQGFIKSCELGVSTLEMDVVISRDREVVVSHEHYFNAAFTTNPAGFYPQVPEKMNIYQMEYAQVKSIDVGLKQNPRFPEQTSVAAYKPTLIEVLKACKSYPVKFNIEIKRTPEGDGMYHPEPVEFVALVLEVIESLELADRVNLQSFDIETLQIVKRQNPKIKLALLCEDRWATLDKKIKLLGFLPDIYSPQYRKVTIPLVSHCHKLGVKLIPWTVNQVPVMRKLIRWGVDGIITDYPDRLIKLVKV